MVALSSLRESGAGGSLRFGRKGIWGGRPGSLTFGREGGFKLGRRELTHWQLSLGREGAWGGSLRARDPGAAGNLKCTLGRGGVGGGT